MAFSFKNLLIKVTYNRGLFMQKLFPVLLSCVSLLFAGVDVHVNVNFGPPEIDFPAPPPVVLVTPGIYVVPDYPEEVFFISGAYWVTHEGRWFRCVGPHKKWIMVQESRIPHGLLKLPRGMYKNWHPEKHGSDGDHNNGDHNDNGDHGQGRHRGHGR
jgi:hypothetical protein